jgi:hypothetical protein
MKFFTNWLAKKSEDKEETFFKFYVSDDGEEINYNFEALDIDKFLQMMAILLSGGMSEEIIDCIFKEIKDDEVRNDFIIDILARTEISLKEKGDSIVVSPSAFNV